MDDLGKLTPTRWAAKHSTSIRVATPQDVRGGLKQKNMRKENSVRSMGNAAGKACARRAGRHVLDIMRWTCVRHGVDMQLTCGGHVVDMW